MGDVVPRLMKTYRVSQLSVDRFQFLTVWTRRRVKLDQNIFIRVIDHVIERLSNNHLYRVRVQEGQRSGGSEVRSVCQTHLDSSRVLLRYRFRLHVTFESTCKVIF